MPRQVWIAGVAAAVLAAVLCWLPNEVRLRVPEIEVTWRSGTAAEARDYVERKRRLRPSGESGGRVTYLVTSPAADLATLASAPGIDVVTGVDGRTGEPRRWRELTLVEWLLRVHGRDARPYLKPTTAAFVFWLAVAVTLILTRSGRAWLVSRVPAIDARVLGACRIILGGGLAVVAALATWPAVVWQVVAVALAVTFVAGVWPRAALAAFGGLLAWALEGDAADHDYFAPFQAWILCLAVPWAEGVWPWRVTAPGAARASRRYGLAVTTVPLVLGTAYLAAALAKLDQSTHAWLAGGAIRYHIAQDGPAAPGSLWRFVASQDWLTVPLSPLVILCEAVVIAAAMTATPLVRCAGFTLALGLHLGFGLLQGVWWEAWWVLLPLFLPWPQIVSRVWPARPADVTGGTLPGWTAAALAVFLLQQPVASLLRLEWKPLVSNFPMYSNVPWTSPEEYAAHMDRSKMPSAPALRLVAAGGTPLPEIPPVIRGLEACGTLVALAAPVVVRESVLPPAQGAIEACSAAYARRYPTEAPLGVESSPRRFSWAVVDFVAADQWVPAGRLGR